MSDSQTTKNLFERKTVHFPVPLVDKSAAATPASNEPLRAANEILPSMPGLSPAERPLFQMPPEESLPRFQLCNEPTPEAKMYLMVRSSPQTTASGLHHVAAAKAQHNWLKTTLRSGLLLLLLIGGGGILYNLWENPERRGDPFFGLVAVPSPSPTSAAPEIAADNAVIARAVVKPLRSATLEMANSGPVAQIFVKEGEFVQAGQPLLQLDNTLQTIEVAQANAELAQAKSHLQEIEAGYRPEEIAAAQASLDAAKARLLSASSESVRQSDLAAAQSQLASAQAQLQDALNGPKEAALVEARANLQNAEATLQQASSAYNQVKWRSDIGMLPEALALQKATNDYQAAKARYDLLAQPATAATISNLRAQVEEARANLVRVQTPTKQSDLDAIAAEMRKAEADLQLMQAGERPEVVARTRAEVQAAEVTLLHAQAVLSQTTLIAPFAGLVGDVSVEVGEQVAPGKPLVQLGDVSGWRIETSDLTELDIPKVQEGAPVAIEIDALPGEQLAGTVSQIKRWGEDKVGDIVYTVEIMPSQSDPRLRWNMTAAVTIQEINVNAAAASSEGEQP